MKNKSILLVDDEAIILQSLAKNLIHENFSVTKAANAEEALDLLEKKHFDLVVTDLVMPGLGGIEVLKEAKKQNPFMGVLILTGYGDLSTAINALRLGADDYLLKPCEPDEFILRIRRCIEKYEAFQKLQLYENILPICMYCKNIRDDSGTAPGKGKWMRMDLYLHKKTGTDISHGICPDCQERARKEMYDEL